MIGSRQPDGRGHCIVQSGPAANRGSDDGAPLGAGPVRLWRGMLIQSLDAVPRRPLRVQTPEPPLPSPAPFARLPPSPRLAPGLARPHAHALALSNERTFTVWAHANECARIYAEPFAQARHVADLRSYTEEGLPEIYVLLRLHRDAEGREWVQLRLPMRPNGEVGWVRRGAIGSFRTTRDLLVLDRRRLRLRFFSGGRLRWSQLEAEGVSAGPSNGCIGVPFPDNAWLGVHLRLGTPLRVL